MKQPVLLLRVFFVILLSKDVPFKNGKYTHGKHAFNDLREFFIQSDSSHFFLILLFIVSSNLKEQIASHLIIRDESDYDLDESDYDLDDLLNSLDQF